MAGRFAFAPKTVQNARDVASTAGDAAKTFFFSEMQDPDKRVYPTGAGPAPPTPTPAPPANWTRSFGRYSLPVGKK